MNRYRLDKSYGSCYLYLAGFEPSIEPALFALGAPVRFDLLDTLRCSCGHDELRVEGAVTSKTAAPESEGERCRRFCGFRQRPVSATDLLRPECRDCRQHTILQGTIRCQCGQKWPIVDGVPSFSTRGLAKDRSRRFQVSETNPRTDPRWEPFVRAHPGGSPFHHPGWLRALEEEYGQTRLHLAAENQDGRLIAILPMFYTRGLPFNLGGHMTVRRLSSLPRTPFGGVLSRDPEATAALLEAAVDYSRRGSGVQLQIKAGNAELETRAPGLVATPWRPTFVTRLPESPEEIQFGNSANRHRLKWAVNKARKHGLQVRDAETESEVRAWYPLYLEVMRQNAIPPRPYRFFRALWELLRPAGVMRLLLAEREVAGQRTLLAGSIILTFGALASYAFTGGRKQDFIFHPNDLIQWEAIHEACRMGARRYDFGEVAEEHQALVNFKSKWGAEPQPQFRYYCPAPSTPAACEKKSPGYVRELTAAAWRRFPLRATTRLGEWIYSYL